jgi:hypothetical protein
VIGVVSDARVSLRLLTSVLSRAFRTRGKRLEAVSAFTQVCALILRERFHHAADNHASTFPASGLDERPFITPEKLAVVLWRQLWRAWHRSGIGRCNVSCGKHNGGDNRQQGSVQRQDAPDRAAAAAARRRSLVRARLLVPGASATDCRLPWNWSAAAPQQECLRRRRRLRKFISLGPRLPQPRRDNIRSSDEACDPRTGPGRPTRRPVSAAKMAQELWW